LTPETSEHEGRIPDSAVKFLNPATSKPLAGDDGNFDNPYLIENNDGALVVVKHDHPQKGGFSFKCDIL